MPQRRNARRPVPRPAVTARGFTFLELAVVLAVALTIFALAIPSFRQYVQRKATQSAAEALQGDLRDVRAAHFANSGEARLMRVAFGGSVASRTSCYVVYLGNATCDCTAEPACPSGTEVVKLVRPDRPAAQVGVAAASPSVIEFQPMLAFPLLPGTTTPTSLSVGVGDASGDRLRVDVNAVGRVSICNVEGFPSYGACS